VRLTLRTLLAYLDDTLEPLEIKRIGQKVAESDTARELIARIKQVTRRRRITTPPATGPNSFDPNMVADYLDSELSPEKIAELEKICLESDVHLAEVASCHQILTLVLGEPASVPPTAKERMYSLVQGREAIPFRKASTGITNAVTSGAGDHDADEMFLLGLPLYRRGSWLRWVLPLVGVVLLAVVGVALWRSISEIQQPNSSGRVAKADQANDKNGEAKRDETKDVAKPDNAKKAAGQLDMPAETKSDKPVETKSDKPVETKSDKPVETDAEARKAPPSDERVEAGSYYFGPKSQPSILVQRKQDGWHRLASPMRVSTAEPLVSLPGYASEVRLDSGVHLLLRGHVREFSLFPDMNYLQESAVVLHKSGKDVDADLTLQCGRLYLSNHKRSGPAIVRLRFAKEVWDLTLKDEGAEVVVDLLKRYNADVDYTKGEDPATTLALCVLSGKAGLAAGHQHFPSLSAPPGQAAFMWNNKGRDAGLNGPNKLPQVPPFLRDVLPVDAKKNPDAEKMDLAIKRLSDQMLANKDPIVVLQEVLQTTKDPNDLFRHRLAIYSLGALDAVNELLDVLGDTDLIHYHERDTAIFTLRRWLARDAENGTKLFNPKTNKGILQEQKMYTSREAERMFALLHDPDENQISSVETYDKLALDLVSNKVAIAELARWQLFRLALIQGVKVPSLEKFNAAAPREAREAAYSEVRDKIDKGELPVQAIPSEKGTGGPSPDKRPKTPKKPNGSGSRPIR
jgi:hypothetical protein